MLSNFVDEIKYIPLETNPESLIPFYNKIQVTEKYIIVQWRNSGKTKILLFDKETGKFLKEIGKQGRGPQEYGTTLFVPYNKFKKEIYGFKVPDELVVYDISGSYKGKIKLPTRGGTFMGAIDNEVFASYIPNMTGSEGKKIILFTKDSVIKIIPNLQTWENLNNHMRAGIGSGYAQFYSWNDKFNFCELFCDTLYQVTEDGLIPRYFFDWGKYNAPYSQAGETIQPLIESYYVLQYIVENNNYIFIKILFKNEDHIGFIDKRTNILTFCKKDSPDEISKLKDDVSGLMDVEWFLFTESNEMVYEIQPAKLKGWLSDNPDKGARATQEHPWLNNIDEFSNPIIAIAKCHD